MVELKYFERSDFKQLINWIDSPAFLGEVQDLITH